MAKNKGFAGMSYDKIMMQQALSKVEEPTYCRYCGQNVKIPSNNSPSGGKGNWRAYLDWEVQNEAHHNCHQLHLYNQRR